MISRVFCKWDSGIHDGGRVFCVSPRLLLALTPLGDHGGRARQRFCGVVGYYDKQDF